MLPMITLGVTVGSILYQVLPDLIILICLVSILVFLVTLNTCKLRKMCGEGEQKNKVTLTEEGVKKDHDLLTKIVRKESTNLQWP